jgi:hypothetical protein
MTVVEEINEIGRENSAKRLFEMKAKVDLYLYK